MTAVINAHSLGRHLAGWQSASSGRGGAATRLSTAIAAQLLDGRIALHTRLPSERDLATELHVSRTTIATAYARLREQGFLTSRRGAGSWTAMPQRSTRAMAPLVPGAFVAEGTIDLGCAAPGASASAIVDAFTAAADALPAELIRAGSYADHGYHPHGLEVLRAVLAERFTARGLPTTADQILVTVGAQGAISLLAQVLLRERDVVLIEQPSYPNAADALRRSRARLVGVPLTADGWDEAFADALAQSRPKLAYVIPEFQNPTGALMTAAEREELVRAARAAGTLLIADETLVDLPLDGQEMPPPVAAFDRDGRVITIGSLSKAFWGGMRIGWIRATPRLIRQLGAARSSIDMGTPVVDQLAGVHLLARSAELVGARRSELVHGRDILEAALREHLPDWRWTRPTGGLSLWVTLDRPVSTALTDAAERHGLHLAAGPRFGLDGTLERFLRLPFTLPADELREAAVRLAAASADLDERGHGWRAAGAVVA
ncbi:MAG: putative GntR-family transcriptional regulator [Frankiales bacterium]|nr:putative GntR-family transcriptional regulator [Frankiales bacterium]